MRTKNVEQNKIIMCSAYRTYTNNNNDQEIFVWLLVLSNKIDTLLTRLDSSGDAKLSRSTLTLTVNVSVTKYKDMVGITSFVQTTSYSMIVKRILREPSMVAKLIYYSQKFWLIVDPSTNFNIELCFGIFRSSQ